MDYEFYWDEDDPQYDDIERLLETNEYARNLYQWGFIDPDIPTEFRNAARESFFDYLWELGYEPDFFDWKEWRDDYLATLAS